MRRIASHYALVNGALKRGIVVEVDDLGTITRVSQHDNIDNIASVEFYPGILIPGMVNAHSHLELAYLRGAIAEGSGFAGFAREIGRVRGNYTTEERLHAASVADSEMWHEGVEAVMDIANDDLIMPIKERSKIEYHTLFEVFGLNTQSCDTHRAMAAKYHNSDITTHSTYSLQDTIFRDIAQEGCETLSVHLLESDDETLLYHKSGSLWDWYTRMGWECDFLHYGSPAKRISESVPATRRTMLVHGCKSSKEDISLLNNHFDIHPTWVLCPESNRYISAIKPPVAMFREMGAKLAIGTDSLASARHLSMVGNMRLLGDVPLTELLTYATLNGAKALGIADRKGSIEVGKQPGLAVISGIDFQAMRLTEESESRRIL
ncbi:MAG: amidohydrolase family protein [Alistipes sp.]|nr:amidohydrolase family protein [Alistipes sp.]